MRIDSGGSRGILAPRPSDPRIVLERRPAAGDLADVIERHWSVRWDLTAPHSQETLSSPQINVVFGAHQPGVHGVCKRRFVAALDGAGWVFATKIVAGAFGAFWPGRASELTDRSLPVGELFGEDGAALERAVLAAPDDDARAHLVEGFLRARRAPLSEGARLATAVVGVAQSDPSIVRVGELAARAGVGERTLQRVFAAHVGASPGWVVRRFRVQEAADRVTRGEAVDWLTVAHDLGYCDQAHFIHDFKTHVGRTPGEYAALCAR